MFALPMIRRCGLCAREKPIEDFAWRRKDKGLFDNYCRPCRALYKQRHYEANKDRYIANAKARTQRVLEERMRYVIEYLRNHPCVDCGEDDVLVLEFDHRQDKSFSVSYGIRTHNWDVVLAEIEKCDVRCANCHRRRTGRSQGFLRVYLADSSGLSSST